MEENNKMICADEVISLENRQDNVLISHHTYQASEFLNAVGNKIDHHKKEQWVDQGVPCKMLSPNQTWQKGRIKICLQFIPDSPKSILDDIRQEMEQDNV